MDLTGASAIGAAPSLLISLYCAITLPVFADFVMRVQVQLCNILPLECLTSTEER